MIKNGRQIGTTLNQIREDHRLRYQVAIDLAKEKKLNTAVDFGTGTGYGAYMMAIAGLVVEAFEIDQSAIDYGNQHYSHERLTRCQADIAELTPPHCDLMTGFEIVEHTEHAPGFLRKAVDHAGWLVVSVPNELVVPFGGKEVHSQHYRHYTPDELVQELTGCGWNVRQVGSQIGKRGDDARVRWDNINGRTLVAICES